MDLDLQQFFTGDVIQATGIDNTNLQSWLSRGYIEIPGPAKPGTGQRRLFPAKAIIQLAITKELVDAFGMRPEDATWIADTITLRPHSGAGRYLKAYLEHPTGEETEVFKPYGPAEGSTPRTGSIRWTGCGHEHVDWEPGPDDTLTWTTKRGYKSAAPKMTLVVGVGAIAKTVLARLQKILDERTGVQVS